MLYGNEKSSETIEGLLSDLETPKRFFPEQLEKFTAGFSKSLGSGAFGDVFKGVLHDGLQVAVKVLKGGILSDSVKDQFKAEVSVLGKIHHKHVVKLYGFCFEQNMKALVYEFMENGSLEKHLYGNQSIAWETMCNIAVGTAKGLAYLHEDCQPRILHYDVKPANILLDSKFSPKVGDFGLAKRLNQDTTHITATSFRGTPNYAAPELYVWYLSVTDKCDVYSFGISLFDIIGRRKHRPMELGEEWFPVQVWKKFKEEKHEEIIQECGIREKNKEQAKRILLIALWCAQFLPDDRPSMSHVVRLLVGREEIAMPPNPFLYICSSSTTQIKYPTPKSSPSMKASSSFTEEVKLPPNTFPMHMGSSSAVTEGDGEDNISRTTIGPWGGDGGDPWDDGIFDGIKKIKVFKGIQGDVCSIQVFYCGKDGESISTRRHGDREANTIDTMELDYPSEYLIRVTGFYGYEFGNDGYLLVRSLCFFTNKKIYGPFGDERGIYFTSENDGKDGKVVGFHGREGGGLDAIGTHIEYNKDHQDKLKENDTVNVTRIKPTTVGPWGGDGGDNWDDGVSPGIKKIKIYKGIKGNIQSMQILYCGNDGDPIWSQMHGCVDTHTIESNTIELDYPSEYLVRVTGFHGYESGEGRFDRVRSLCFFSNKKKYGPFGDETGTCFSTEKDGKDGKVVGFHGRGGYYLDAIGMHILLESTEEVKLPPNLFLMHMGSSSAVTKGDGKDNISRTTIGPWGGNGGDPWDDGIFDGIKKIKVFKGIKGDVCSIQVWYCGKDGESISTRRHGDREAHTIDTMELDYPSEYLMRVTGYYGYEFGNDGYLLVRSICFFTNKKIYGPFGDERGIYFTSENDGKYGKVVGFHGREGGGLDAIGTHMEYNKDHQEKLKENDAVNVTSIKPTTVGPWGGGGGDNWDDGVSPGIKKIKIYKGIKGDIRSMQIVYCGNDGDPIWSQMHGCVDTHTTESNTIELDYPSEYLVRVMGFHGYESGDRRFDRVRSLCFFSNKKKYGPFGDETGTCFSTEKDGKDGKVIGFHGRAEYYLDAIGMHMEYS